MNLLFKNEEKFLQRCRSDEYYQSLIITTLSFTKKYPLKCIATHNIEYRESAPNRLNQRRTNISLY